MVQTDINFFHMYSYKFLKTLWISEREISFLLQKSEDLHAFQIQSLCCLCCLPIPIENRMKIFFVICFPLNSYQVYTILNSGMAWRRSKVESVPGSIFIVTAHVPSVGGGQGGGFCFIWTISSLNNKGKIVNRKKQNIITNVQIISYKIRLLCKQV